MFDDVGKTIKAILYDRITSPLFGTFLLSWCGWNWRLIALFLTDSSTTVAKKFLYLDTDLYPNNGVTFFYGLLLPLATTAFFIYIYPWFAKKVYGYWREQQNELKKLQVEKDGEKPLTKEEAQEITNQALLSELRYQEEREKREARIRNLEELVKSLQAASEIPAALDFGAKSSTQKLDRSIAEKPKKTGYSPEVEDGMFSLLKFMDKLTSGAAIGKPDFLQKTFSDAELSKLDKTFVLHCLDNLLADNFVLSTSMGQLIVQPKGRAALVNKSLDT